MKVVAARDEFERRLRIMRLTLQWKDAAPSIAHQSTTTTGSTDFTDFTDRMNDSRLNSESVSSA